MKYFLFSLPLIVALLVIALNRLDALKVRSFRKGWLDGYEIGKASKAVFGSVVWGSETDLVPRMDSLAERYPLRVKPFHFVRLVEVVGGIEIWLVTWTYAEIHPGNWRTTPETMKEQLFHLAPYDNITQ